MSAQKAAHPTETAEYWLALAKDERKLAAQERSSRWATVESIQIRLRNAADYEAHAAKIMEAQK